MDLLIRRVRPCPGEASGLCRCLSDTSGSPAAGTGRSPPPSTCILSLHLSAFPVSGETSLCFTGVASRTGEMIQGEIWLFFLSPAGRRYKISYSGRGMPWMSRWLKSRQKTPKISFFFVWWVLFLCVVNLLVHQKGWRPRKGKQQARLKNFMCRKKGYFFFPLWFATYFRPTERMLPCLIW